MSRIGFVLKVKTNLIGEYRSRHREVWPEMLAALTGAGWHNYSLFMRANGTLFGYFETTGSFADALEAMALQDVNDRWQREMAAFFEPVAGGADARPDRMMEELVEVFHLD